MSCNYDKVQKYNDVNESKEYLYIKNLELLQITNELLKLVRKMLIINFYNRKKMKKLIDIYDKEAKNKKQLLIEINSYKEGF